MNDKLVLAMRIILGAIFLVLGLNGFLQFIPMPPLNQASMDFMMALGASGYLIPLLKITEIVAGVLLLIGKKVPLALILLAPIVVNIALFHLVLSKSGYVVTSAIVVMQLVLMVANKDKYQGLLD